jgi:hypothetical protein
VQMALNNAVNQAKLSLADLRFKTEIDPLIKVHSNRPLTELDRKASEMLSPEIQKAKRLIGRLDPDFAKAQTNVPPNQWLEDKRQQNQSQFDLLAEQARAKYLMTSPARSARIGAKGVDPNNLMSQAAGYRAPASGIGTSAHKFGSDDQKPVWGQGHGDAPPPSGFPSRGADGFPSRGAGGGFPSGGAGGFPSGGAGGGFPSNPPGGSPSGGAGGFPSKEPVEDFPAIPQEDFPAEELVEMEMEVIHIREETDRWVLLHHILISGGTWIKSI